MKDENNMNFEELKEKYKDVPSELKEMKRWVCYKVEGMENGKTTKRPYNSLSGKLARVNDDLTWTTFKMALMGYDKYKFDGIGFVLGNGIMGVDLDNHPDASGEAPMSDSEFSEFSKEFVEKLNSYTEYSQSGKGIHIICKGELPDGPRRKGSVEMYDNVRFFAFTGNTINNTKINDRAKEIKELWEKYVNVEQEEYYDNTYYYDKTTRRELKLDDEEIIRTAISSAQGSEFYSYYHDGDISKNNNDASAADMSFCNMLAFWCNGDKEQMDRIFRNSALMRDKWDQRRGQHTYGEITIFTAARNTKSGYVRTEKIEGASVESRIKNKSDHVFENEIVERHIDENTQNFTTEMNIDENGEPIFKIKKNLKKYQYTDTGNAQRFYDYFGDIFRYNKTDKVFMFWTGKVWQKDTKDIIRKYANKLIEILKQEESRMEEDIEEANAAGEVFEVKRLSSMLESSKKNTNRISNKAGKDAMLSELQSIEDIAVESSDFNKDDYLLNTQSGVVDLNTCEIKPFDKELLLSKITNVKISYEEPTEWLKFLKSVFESGDKYETQEIIDSLQTCLGYSLSGSTKEQVMFLLVGGGSNGKSTLTEEISYILGNYGDNIASNVLMTQKNNNNSATYSIAKLQGARFVETGETDEGGKLAEAQIKILTGGDSISAQFKYGNEFSFRPKFKIWMSTNNRPIIRGTDLGIWRRIFLFLFENTFTGSKKDKFLPDKLKTESDKILGWMIKGYSLYKEKGDLIRPSRIDDAIKDYKQQMDVVSLFIKKRCEYEEGAWVRCSTMYQAYKEWSLDNSEFTMKESKFCEELCTKGVIVTQNLAHDDVYMGIKLKGSVTIRDTSKRWYET